MNQQRQELFPTTRWSLILSPDCPQAQQERAAEDICRLYWRPVFLFIRGSNHRQKGAAEDAEDLTQRFFAGILSSGFFGKADPAKGRLRNYLLGAVQKFLLAAHREDHAQKRGGYAAHVPLEDAMESPPAAGGLLPDEEFDRQWALCLLEQCLAQLRDEYTLRGKEALYLALKPMLTSNLDTDPPTAGAGELKMSDGAQRVALHRLRLRYRQILLEKVSETLLPGMDPAEEIAALARLLGGSKA